MRRSVRAARYVVPFRQGGSGPALVAGELDPAIFAPHTGLCEVPGAWLERLLDRVVRAPRRGS